MPRELECDDQKRFGGTTIGEGVDRRRPVARAEARRLAYQYALENVLGFYAGAYSCPSDGCPNLLLIAKFGRPVDDTAYLGPIPGGPFGIQPGWTCRALCEWSVIVECTEDEGPNGNQDMVEQDLDCWGEQATAWGTEIGQGLGTDRDGTIAKVERDVLERAAAKAAAAIGLINCDDDCPNKKVRVTLSPPLGTFCPKHPNQDGDFVATSNARWRVAVTCF
jgi:hypothetical protein